MKIQTSVRQIFDEQLGINELLLAHVDSTMRGVKEARWHYESRLKTLESFAVKLETARVKNPKALEDFLACTLVVTTTGDIPRAISLVKKHFKVRYRRPIKDGETHKAADCFPFDDVRLYCVRRNDGSLPPEPIDDVVFEVQVKTFLQHAWGIATHDFNYKTDVVTWGKDRVVAHLKAALEHVELSLQEASNLSTSPFVDLINPKLRNISEVIDILRKHWKRSELPYNLRGLADSVSSILALLRIGPSSLDSSLASLRKASSGLPLNLSPYGVVVSALAATHAPALNAALAASPKPMMLITPELLLPAGFPSAEAAAKTIQI
ncbi:hypothetical protein [Mesorhizobium caraganae]|uniref:hypothetical protein n=1 Tax=Mesorhizobium caraganae TaxID=483206 RepID=UPI0017812EA2|nr:hypothetical protein [Mesorhizobium caraganae]